MPLLFGDFFKLILEFLLFSASGFMILLVLVQRGRGGGLTGALGGMGGQSAFGAKAGDVFTRITVISAIIWIFLCLITIRSYSYVPVNTTAMKEYQYTKLMKDSSVGFGNEEDVSSSLNLGRNPDDGPGAIMNSKDSEADKAAGKKAEKEDDQNAPKGDNDGETKKDEAKKDESPKTNGDEDSKGGDSKTPSTEKKNAEKKNAEKKSESKTSEPDKNSESKSEEKKPGTGESGKSK